MAHSTRKTAASSVNAEVAAFSAAATDPLEPPPAVKLRADDRPIWDAVVRARSRSEWSDVDLMHAANLTRCLTDIERISAEITAEGDTLENARGTCVANPKHALLETLSRRAVALTRLLHLHAGAFIRPTQVMNQRETEARARETVQQLQDDDDGLLATPLYQ
jgi:hypothetical protein